MHVNELLLGNNFTFGSFKYIVSYVALLTIFVVEIDRVIKYHHGDTSSLSSLKDGAVYNLIKGIKKNDLKEQKLVSLNE